jgi:hypothetical protein
MVTQNNIGYPGSTLQTHRIQTETSVNLQINEFSPAMYNGNLPIIFVSGLSTIMESFGHVIRNLTKDYPLYFIETREHPSSILGEDEKYDIESNGNDLVAIVEELDLQDKMYILMGYSFGVTIITDAYTKLKTKPFKIIFLEPTPEFHYPKWTVWILEKTKNHQIEYLKTVAKWYMRNFVINKKGDPEMVRISATAINNCDQKKLKKTAIAIAPYQGWDKPENIDCQVLILAASLDTMHMHEETMRLQSLLRDCRYVDMVTNEKSHSNEAAEVMREFIKEKL